MKVNVKFTVITALATCVAGAVLLSAGCGEGEAAGEGGRTPLSNDGGRAGAQPSKLIPDAAKDGLAGSRSCATETPQSHRSVTGGATNNGKQTWPDALARVLVENAVSNNDYEDLARLRDRLDKIEDPDVRLRLLEGLAWFDETAVADALAFLLDSDKRVATLASEVVTSRMAFVKRPSQRKKLYAAALKLMPVDSPDREILVSTLENDKKRVLIGVLDDLESMKSTDPALWKRLTEAYETSTGLPYTGHIDALRHYDPRADR